MIMRLTMNDFVYTMIQIRRHEARRKLLLADTVTAQFQFMLVMTNIWRSMENELLLCRIARGQNQWWTACWVCLRWRGWEFCFCPFYDFMYELYICTRVSLVLHSLGPALYSEGGFSNATGRFSIQRIYWTMEYHLWRWLFRIFIYLWPNMLDKENSKNYEIKYTLRRCLKKGDI